MDLRPSIPQPSHRSIEYLHQKIEQSRQESA